MKLELPLFLSFPSPELFPNKSNGRHWGGKQSAKELARKEGFYLAVALRNASGVPFEKKRAYALRIEFVQAKLSRDLDNMLAALKPALDGVAMGLGINDKQFQPITISTSRGNPGVMVWLEIEASN